MKTKLTKLKYIQPQVTIIKIGMKNSILSTSAANMTGRAHNPTRGGYYEIPSSRR